MLCYVCGALRCFDASLLWFVAFRFDELCADVMGVVVCGCLFMLMLTLICVCVCFELLCRVCVILLFSITLVLIRLIYDVVMCFCVVFVLSCRAASLCFCCVLC